ncbi:hypothetical protein [Alicyclobacillus sp. SO9]|uniref:hypothetical protein n=1 Tax=Alicyclobacillus sp. SO9 TaxID=2665646 RepID=UPI0018E897E5|nr:hypothetical protein [Alicyclobacillus sp. SO9]QQE77418.1 hypothetical protein GI364_15850 [Alicyclobacillus sp. SO9]
MKRYSSLITLGAVTSLAFLASGCSAHSGTHAASTEQTNQSSHRLTHVYAPGKKLAGNKNSTLAGHSLPRSLGNMSFPSNGKNSYLISLNMMNSKTGYLSGYLNGHFSIWRTVDGGHHWNKTPVPQVPVSNSESSFVPVVFFKSSTDGWAAWIGRTAKGHILHVLTTTNGGRTWGVHAQKVLSVANYIRAIDFSSLKDGWIQAFSGGVMNQGDTTIFHTGNGGKTWTMVSSAGGYVPNQHATAHALPELDVSMPMTFTNAVDGWVAVGNVVRTKTMASLYHTNTVGRVWSPVHLPVPKGDKEGFVTTGYKPVFSGKTGTELFQFYHAGENNIVSYRTSNYGSRWNIESVLSLQHQDARIRESYLNADEVWIIGSSGTPFERTEDGGRSWSRVAVTGSIEKLLHSGFTVKKLEMVTRVTGWMLLNYMNPQNGRIHTSVLKTTDGGTTWSVQTCGG